MEHPAIVSACAFLAVMMLITWSGYRFIYKPGRLLSQLGRPLSGPAPAATLGHGDEPQASTIVAVLHNIGRRMPSSEAEVATLRTDLIRAGFRSETAAPVFYGLRIITTLVMLCLAIMLEGHMPDNPVMTRGAHGFRVRRRLDSAALLPGKEGCQAAGGYPAFAPRCARSAGGLGGSRTGSGPGHSARGARAAGQPSGVERGDVAGHAGNAGGQTAFRRVAQSGESGRASRKSRSSSRF